MSLPGSVSVHPPCPLTPRFLPQTDVFIAMELMGTCAEKLKKRIQGPIPERILGKMTVAVSGEGTLGDTWGHCEGPGRGATAADTPPRRS